MRTVLATLALLIGIPAGVDAVAAADISSGYGASYPAYGRAAGRVVIYDVEPGVTMRPYWLPPWQNRHYYPGQASASLREPEPAGPPQRAQRFDRYWSTAPTYIREPHYAEPPLYPPLK